MEDHNKYSSLEKSRLIKNIIYGIGIESKADAYWCHDDDRGWWLNKDLESLENFSYERCELIPAFRKDTLEGILNVHKTPYTLCRESLEELRLDLEDPRIQLYKKILECKGQECLEALCELINIVYEDY
jgi:hypothetical protein